MESEDIRVEILCFGIAETDYRFSLAKTHFLHSSLPTLHSAVKKKGYKVLKVLGGSERGRILKTLPHDDLSIRPMLGRMKKSVFDIIQFCVKDCCFLDLFAGVGSVGCEALSRGAAKCVFAELSKTSLDLIKHNVNMLGYNDRARIVRCDVIKDFELIAGKYDIVFMGPPYKDGDKKALALTQPTLKNIVKYDILKEDSVLIAQKHIKEPVGNVSGLERFRIEKYGDTEVSFYRRAK